MPVLKAARNDLERSSIRALARDSSTGSDTDQEQQDAKKAKL